MAWLSSADYAASGFALDALPGYANMSLPGNFSDVSKQPSKLVAAALGPFVYSTLCFILLDIFFISRFAKHYGTEFACRMTSIAHAVVSTAAAYSVITNSPPGVFDSFLFPINPLARTRPEEAAAIAISAGYFVADTLMMILLPEMRSFTYFVHHFLSLVGCFVPIYFGQFGSVTSASLFWLEMTGPHLNLRWILMRLLGLHEANENDAALQAAVATARTRQPALFALFNCISKAMLVQYIPARLVFLPVACYRTVANCAAGDIGVIYAAQGLTATTITLFSIKIFFSWVHRELHVGPGSWE